MSSVMRMNEKKAKSFPVLRFIVKFIILLVRVVFRIAALTAMLALGALKLLQFISDTSKKAGKLAQMPVGLIGAARQLKSALTTDKEADTWTNMTKGTLKEMMKSSKNTEDE